MALTLRNILQKFFQSIGKGFFDSKKMRKWIVIKFFKFCSRFMRNR
jgi:hypothetical protein